MREELRSAFFSKKFILAFAVMLLCFLGFSVPEWIMTGSWGEYGSNAMQQAIGGIFFGSVLLLMPFCASVPYATSQVDEIRTSYMFTKALRGSIKKYAFHKAIAVILTGAAIAAGAFAIHALIWSMIALPCDPVTYPYHEIQFAGTYYNEWYKILYGLPLYLSVFIGLAICGALWAVIGLSVSVWIPDHLLVVTVPIGIYYLWMRNAKMGILGITFPTPDTLYTEGLTPETLLQALVMNAVCFIFAFIVYYVGLKRRIKNG